jgi:hypothetical protein
VKRKVVAVIVGLLATGVLSVVLAARDGGPGKGESEARFGERPKELVHERADSSGVREREAASSEDVENRAYPRTYVESKRALAAKHAYKSKPKRPSHDDSSSARAASTNAAITAAWQELGPTSPNVPAEVSYTHVATQHSGRVTAMAIDRACGQPNKGCRLWVAAAGGGIWRTDHALATKPAWASTSSGLDSFAIGSIYQASANTLYAGTGEPNGSADSEAGVGLYRSTDGGGTWSLVDGSRAVAMDRSIGAVAVDPTNSQHIYIGTDLARHGMSSTYGGRRTPPNAPTLGLYESTDGGASFSLAFSRPGSPNDPAAGTGADFFQGGVNQIRLDPLDPQTVYVSVFGYGVWRRSSALDGDSSFHRVFATRNPNDTFGDRTQIAVTAVDPDNNPATNNNTTRIYAGDGSDDELISELWRTDNANRRATKLANNGGNNIGWTKLSSSKLGSDGFTSYNYCQEQCGYDDPVVVDPRDPNTVWLGGQMAYGEIPGAEGGTPRSNGRAVIRSTNAGVSFTDMTADTHHESLHPDIHDIVLNPRNPNIAFIGSDGGVTRVNGTYANSSADCDSRLLDSLNLTTCHTLLSSIPVNLDTLNDGLATLQFQDITFNPNDQASDLAGGTQDNGTWTGPGSWLESIGGDGGPAAIGLDGIRQHTYTGTTGDVNFHGNGPATWDYNTQPMDFSPDASAFYAPLIADPARAGTLFEGMQHVWRTLDNGGDQAQLDAHCRDDNPLANLPAGDHTIVCGDWVPAGPDLTDPALGDRAGQYVVQLARAPSNSSTLWAATRFGRLFVSRNADASDAASVTYDRIDTASTPGRHVSGIAVDPAHPNTAYISYSGYSAYTPSTPGHLFKARYSPTTHSATFTDLSYDLGDQPILDVAFDQATGDLFVGTDFGVEHLPAGATAWERVDANLPPVAVYGLSLAPSARKLYAATHGRGIFSLQLP